MKAKGEIGYAITYISDGKLVTWQGYEDLDYFYARYCFLVLSENTERYQSPTLLRVTKNDDGTVTREEIDANIRSDKDARYAVFGTTSPLLDVRYSLFITTEGEADAYARGIELGIARSAAFLQCAGANTSDDTTFAILDEYAEELLIHAPAYHAQYKSLTAALQRNAQLEKELASLKSMIADAKAEYHERLGEKPQFGIMDLPITRKLLETEI